MATRVSSTIGTSRMQKFVLATDFRWLVKGEALVQERFKEQLQARGEGNTLHHAVLAYSRVKHMFTLSVQRQDMGDVDAAFEIYKILHLIVLDICEQERVFNADDIEDDERSSSVLIEKISREGSHDFDGNKFPDSIALDEHKRLWKCQDKIPRLARIVTDASRQEIATSTETHMESDIDNQCVYIGGDDQASVDLAFQKLDFLHTRFTALNSITRCDLTANMLSSEDIEHYRLQFVRLDFQSKFLSTTLIDRHALQRSSVQCDYTQLADTHSLRLSTYSDHQWHVVARRRLRPMKLPVLEELTIWQGYQYPAHGVAPAPNRQRDQRTNILVTSLGNEAVEIQSRTADWIDKVPEGMPFEENFLHTLDGPPTISVVAVKEGAAYANSVNTRGVSDKVSTVTSPEARLRSADDDGVLFLPPGAASEAVHRSSISAASKSEGSTLSTTIPSHATVIARTTMTTTPARLSPAQDGNILFSLPEAAVDAVCRSSTTAAGISERLSSITVPSRASSITRIPISSIKGPLTSAQGDPVLLSPQGGAMKTGQRNSTNTADELRKAAKAMSVIPIASSIKPATNTLATSRWRPQAEDFVPLLPSGHASESVPCTAADAAARSLTSPDHAALGIVASASAKPARRSGDNVNPPISSPIAGLNPKVMAFVSSLPAESVAQAVCHDLMISGGAATEDEISWSVSPAAFPASAVDLSKLASPSQAASRATRHVLAAATNHLAGDGRLITAVTTQASMTEGNNRPLNLMDDDIPGDFLSTIPVLTMISPTLPKIAILETETRVYHKSMSQKAPRKPTKPEVSSAKEWLKNSVKHNALKVQDPSSKLISAISSYLRPKFELFSSFGVGYAFEAKIVRFVLDGRPELENVDHPAERIAEWWSKDGGIPVLFTSVLTTSPSEIQHIIDMTDPEIEQPMWKTKVDSNPGLSWKVTYEIVTVFDFDGLSQNVVLSIDAETFKHRVYRPAASMRFNVNIHCPKRNWDVMLQASCETEHSQLGGEHAEWAEEVLKTLYVAPGQTHPALSFSFSPRARLSTAQTHIRVRRTCSYQSSDELSSLNVTEVLVLGDMTMFTEMTDKVGTRVHVEAKMTRRTEGIHEPRWFELGVSSTHMDRVFASTGPIAIGERAGWDVAAFDTAKGLAAAYSPALALVTRIDDVGSGNNNGVQANDYAGTQTASVAGGTMTGGVASGRQAAPLQSWAAKGFW